jgi:dihydrolipoamide dehydrogenase
MNTKDLIIVGAGPGGYVAAIRASQLGLKTLIIEREDMGGQCLNWGCIPSKCLLESAKLLDRMKQASTFGVAGVDKKALSFDWLAAVKRKNKIVTRLVRGVEFLMKKGEIEVITGEAEILGPTRCRIGNQDYSASSILLTTGATPDSSFLAALPAQRKVGMKAFYGLDALPERLSVCGANGAACETAVMLALAGYKVNLLVPGDRIMPSLDEDLRNIVLKRMKKLKVKIHLQLSPLEMKGDRVVSGDLSFDSELFVNASDRLANLPVFHGAAPALNAKGFIEVDENGCTSLKSLYAAGDVTGSFFAQAASALATAAVQHMAKQPEPYCDRLLPWNVYMDPEIAMVGKREMDLIEEGIPYKVGQFSMAVNGKALAEGRAEGFVKVLAHRESGEVLGVQIVAEGATDLIAEAVTAMRLEARVEDIARMVHAHPTLSEAFLEASLAAAGRPVHQ